MERTGYQKVAHEMYKKDFTRKPLLCTMKSVADASGFDKTNHEKVLKRIVKE